MLITLWLIGPIVAQESEAPASETFPVTESAPAIPEPVVEILQSAPEPKTPIVKVNFTAPELVPDFLQNSSSDTGPVSSPDNLEETSSLTILDTGYDILTLLEWNITPEATEVLTLFSSSDFLIEIEVIFSELDIDIVTEIQNDPTLADNTDEDPNVDLIDPSIVADPPGPIPEPGSELEIVLQDDPSVVESQGETQSALGLLELLFDSEELSVRRFEKDITLDPSATHTCRADIFRADIRATDFSRARVTLFQNRKKSLPSFLEIGSLPAGIDVVFKSNEKYTYTPGTRETVIEFDITRQAGANTGDFTIPIIYTLQEGAGSSVVCQINILND